MTYRVFLCPNLFLKMHQDVSKYPCFARFIARVVARVEAVSSIYETESPLTDQSRQERLNRGERHKVSVRKAIQPLP